MKKIIIKLVTISFMATSTASERQCPCSSLSWLYTHIMKMFSSTPQTNNAHRANPHFIRNANNALLQELGLTLNAPHQTRAAAIDNE